MSRRKSTKPSTPRDIRKALAPHQIPNSDRVAAAVEAINRPATVPTLEHDRIINNMVREPVAKMATAPTHLDDKNVVEIQQPIDKSGGSTQPVAAVKSEFDIATDYLCAAPIWITNSIIYGVGIAFAGTVVWEFAMWLLPLADGVRHTILSIG
jgi:hypothetical protein